jgi:hypothetical protein
VTTSTETPKTQETPAQQSKRRGRARRLLRFLVHATGWLLLLLVISVVIARPFLPRVVRWYVNQTLDKSVLYQGKIGDVDLHLWRGAYTIHDIELLKTTGNVPVPFFSANEVDLAIQWNALLHRKVVGTILISSPQVNFVDDPGSGEGQTGAGGPWLAIIRGLFPFDINSVHVQDGSIHFRTYQKETPVDVYIDQLQATVDDLTNINRSVTPLITTVNATGLAMDQAKFELHMKLDPFSYDPSFHLALRLLGLDITKTNDLIETYGGFRFKQGFFDLVLDVDSDEGTLTGYVKPFFRNIVVFDLLKDVKDDDPPRFLWQALVGATAAIVTNYNRDQIATLIPFTGSLSGPQIDILGAIGNVIRDAFIRAYLPRLEQTQHDDELQFGPPSLTDPISVGDNPD